MGLSCCIISYMGNVNERKIPGFLFLNIVKHTCTNRCKWWTKWLTDIFELSNFSLFCYEGTLQTYQTCQRWSTEKNKQQLQQHMNICDWKLNMCTYISLPLVMFHAYIWRHGTQTWTKTTSALLHAVYMYIHMLWNLHLWTFKTQMICCCKQGKKNLLCFL